MQTLEATAPRVEPHAKPEYQQLIDSIVVKLSLLQQYSGDLMTGGTLNKRIQLVIKKNLDEMEQAFVRAMSMIQ